MRSILIIAAMTLLAGCAGNPYQSTHQAPISPDHKAQALAESQKKALVIKRLPPDADLENLIEQIRLQELDQYVDIYGTRRSLREPVASAAAPSAAKTSNPVRQPATAPRPTRKARVLVPEESISFDPLPPPIDILGAGGRQ